MRKIFKKSFLSICLASVSLMVTSCANYNAVALSNQPFQQLISTTDEVQGIILAARSFSEEECKQYLDRDVIDKGFQPVQLFFQNNTNKSYDFSARRISLPVAYPEEVARTVHTSTIGRVAGYGIGSLLFWPLVIPAIVDGIKSTYANEALDKDYRLKTNYNHTIAPHSNLNTLIFVPIRDYRNSFMVKLIDLETKEPLLLQVNAS